MRNVAQPAGDFANPALRLVTHGSTAIQNARDGGDGHIGFAGNILDRDHSPPSICPVASLRSARADGELDFWPIYAWFATPCWQGRVKIGEARPDSDGPQNM